MMRRKRRNESIKKFSHDVLCVCFLLFYAFLIKSPLNLSNCVCLILYFIKRLILVYLTTYHKKLYTFAVYIKIKRIVNSRDCFSKVVCNPSNLQHHICQSICYHLESLRKVCFTQLGILMHFQFG